MSERAVLEVRCNWCKWRGPEHELERDADGFAETVCPNCGRDDYLMDNPPAPSQPRKDGRE